MRDITYFTRPAHSWQRRYEALRASFVERMPAQEVADRFGYTPEYIRLLRHMFKHGKIDKDRFLGTCARGENCTPACHYRNT